MKQNQHRYSIHEHDDDHHESRWFYNAMPRQTRQQQQTSFLRAPSHHPWLRSWSLFKYIRNEPFLFFAAVPCLGSSCALAYSGLWYCCWDYYYSIYLHMPACLPALLIHNTSTTHQKNQHDNFNFRKSTRIASFEWLRRPPQWSEQRPINFRD